MVDDVFLQIQLLLKTLCMVISTWGVYFNFLRMYGFHAWMRLIFFSFLWLCEIDLKGSVFNVLTYAYYGVNDYGIFKEKKKKLIDFYILSFLINWAWNKWKIFVLNHTNGYWVAEYWNNKISLVLSFKIKVIIASSG